jgi:hypothetical protein
MPGLRGRSSRSGVPQIEVQIPQCALGRRKVIHVIDHHEICDVAERVGHDAVEYSVIL